MGLRIALAVFVVLAMALFIANRDIPEEEAGHPQISVVFPETSEPGSIQTATFTITNPGPDGMDTLFISFARVGPAQGGGELPIPIVDVGARNENPAIVSIDPEPEAVSLDGVVYRFDALDAGETTTISFDLRIPDDPGPAANSVAAYPGEFPDRARGVRLDTRVEG